MHLFIVFESSKERGLFHKTIIIISDFRVACANLVLCKIRLLLAATIRQANALLQIR